MASSYWDTAMLQILRDERERSALVAALLEGRLLEEMTIWEVADLLRLPRQGPFVVVAAEAAQIAREALPGAETRLRFARIAMATAPPGAPQVTLFDDHPLSVAAVSAPDAMHRVARNVLGPVLD